MNLRSKIVLLGIFLALPGSLFAQLVKIESFEPRTADTIILERNWRTRDRIIMAELEFSAGDTVNQEKLALSLKKIWNLQNFASVAYRWDSLADGRSALVLTARDALTIAPIIAGRLQNHDLTAKLGINDKNFLGRNIRLEIRGQYGESEPAFGEVKLIIPRQLLWKNMSVGTGLRKEQVSGVVFDQLFISVVNPFHQDYHYTFSPDLETGYIRYRNFYPFAAEPPNAELFNHPFWYARVTESVGTITHRRHQEEGYCITGMIGTGIGLTKETKAYIEGGIRVDYHKLVNKNLQFSAHWEGNLSTSKYDYLWLRYGPANIRGIEFGEISGQLMHLVSTGLYYTWINSDWLALEQSLFVQYAASITDFNDWSGIRHHYAVGTGFLFNIPMYPAGSVMVSFYYNPNHDNWFYLEL
jgi:hypothetical protein